MNTIYNGYSTAFSPTRSRLILLCFLLLFTQKLFADNSMHMIQVSLEKRVQAADVVVEGEVISKRSFWDAQHENIYTSNIIKVYKLFKGTLQETQLEIITDGGTVGLDKHVYSVALTLNEGQQGMFFLKQQNRLANTPGNTRFSARPYASEQGFIRYDVQAQTAQGVFENYSSVEQVYRAITKKTGTNYRTITTNKKLQTTSQQQSQKQNSALAAAVITGFSPKTASAGTKTILTITGTGFGNVRGKGFVSFRNADDGGKTFTKSPEDAYLSWTNTQIRMYIPSTGEDGGTAGTGEIKVTPDGGTVFTTTDKITIIYAYSNLYEDSITYQPALIDVDGEGGYTIHFAPNMQSSTNAREGFIRAMNSWICETNVNWKVGAPTTIDKSAADDQIVITFKPESTVGEDVLARTLSRYRGCQVVATGVINWWMSEFDMEINSNISWEYGPGPPEGRQFDFETVMLHELGHAHQLGHVILPRAVMHYALEFARAFRDLSPEDIEGGKVVIASSTQENVATVCRKPVMKPKLDGVCNLAEEVATLQADYNSEHDVVVTWDAVAEENIVRYVVERSEDGINFTEIGSVDAAAANSFTDRDPLQGTGYYRLRVIYKDGSFKYTFVARVTDPSFLFKFEVAPNPVGADQTFTVRFLVNRNTPMQLSLYDTSGKIVRNFEITFTDMNLPLEFDLTGVSAGVYILKWSTAQSSGTTKIVKL
ncbi:T9SS type A sorting domain-containing protein [Pontibacter sp. BT310]|uniref:T9SS type A sorting domain-containing protein n=1 Tax=Pontibacter populi TaxID=890055 RepID=A0ABS6X9G0_9BACT|nr:MULTISPECIES: T9SS type A sorting domain-containing protein [Pontibacter]MBJ6117754.1 T9SS type A sorting domain-containing protein [Pontibacter sp. BT310]MBR0570180.1 T9SS type A sorting domain-containing protein [Microvirga sp. STS03]MBW3364606.1 T9SS type A sorting domain-containing protein [Pontibacter populi]